MKERAVRWSDAAEMVRRWWWALVIVTLVIGGLSVVRWLRTPPIYDATQSVSVAVAPAGTPSGQQSYLAEQQALAIARFVVSPAFLTAPAFDAGVSHALATSPDPSLRDAAPLALGRALVASHSGATITFTATWGNATGAESLAHAAAATLAQGDPALRALLPASDDPPRFQIAAETTPAIRDAAEAENARNTLLTRLALSLLAGVIVMATLGLLERRQGRIHDGGLAVLQDGAG